MWPIGIGFVANFVSATFWAIMWFSAVTIVKGHLSCFIFFSSHRNMLSLCCKRQYCMSVLYMKGKKCLCMLRAMEVLKCQTTLSFSYSHTHIHWLKQILTLSPFLNSPFIPFLNVTPSLFFKATRRFVWKLHFLFFP